MEIDRTRETVLIMRTVHVSMRSFAGFEWKSGGYVEAPDWKPDLECGHGLHGFLYGVGDGCLANFGNDAYHTMVLETYKDVVINLGDKVKFPFCWVVFCGDEAKAAKIIKDKYTDLPVNCSEHVVGDYGIAITGYRGKAVAGVKGKAVAGDFGTAVVLGDGEAIVGRHSVVSAGSFCNIIAGFGSVVFAKNYATINVDQCCEVTSGAFSKVCMRGEGVITLSEGSVVVLLRPNGTEIIYRAGVDLKVGQKYTIKHNAQLSNRK